MVGVEQWAEIRRMHFVGGVSIKEIARRTGRDRNTVRRALRAEGPPGYRRAPRKCALRGKSSWCCEPIVFLPACGACDRAHNCAGWRATAVSAGHYSRSRPA